MRAPEVLLACAFAFVASPAPGQDAPRPASTGRAVPLPGPGERGPDAKRYADQVRPFLVRHCLVCHGTEKPKRNFRLDRLSPDFADEPTRERWLAVLKRVEAGEMPPESKPRPPEKEIRALSDWIRGRVEAADAARRGARGRVVLR